MACNCIGTTGISGHPGKSDAFIHCCTMGGNPVATHEVGSEGCIQQWSWVNAGLHRLLKGCMVAHFIDQ